MVCKWSSQNFNQMAASPTLPMSLSAKPPRFESHSLKEMKRSTKFCSKLFCGYEHVGRTLMTFVILGLTFALIYLLIHLHGENYFTPSRNKIAPF